MVNLCSKGGEIMTLLNDKMVGLANSIRNKSFTDDRLSLDDMANIVNSKLEPLVDDTKNQLPSLDTVNDVDSKWYNGQHNQVGMDHGVFFHYVWRTPTQATDYLSSTIDGAKAGDTFISRFYARADQSGDKVHFEMYGGAGSKDYVLSNYWTPCYSIAKIVWLNADNKSAVYYSSLSSNAGNVSVCLPTLVKLGGAVNASLKFLSDLMCYYLLLNRKEV